MPVDIDALIKILNSNKFLPNKCYRRNVPVYELVCYVNNITACYLSRNLKPIEIFINRAKTYLKDTDTDTDTDNQQYYNLVNQYLQLMEDYILKEHTS